MLRTRTAIVALIAAIGAGGLAAAPATADTWSPWAGQDVPWPQAEAGRYAPDRIGIVRNRRAFLAKARAELHRTYADIYWTGGARNRDAARLFDPIAAALARCAGSGPVLAKSIAHYYAIYSQAKDGVDGLSLLEKHERLKRDTDYASYLWYWLSRYDTRTKKWVREDPERYAYASTRRWLTAIRTRTNAAADAAKDACPGAGRYTITGTVKLTETWSPGSRPPAGAYSIAGSCNGTLTFDGTDVVRVQENKHLEERLTVENPPPANVARNTDDVVADGSFTGSIDGTSLITVGNDGKYTLTYPKPVKEMQVTQTETVTKEFRDGSPPSTRRTTTTRGDTCWDRNGISIIRGALASRTASGSATVTHALGKFDVTSRVEWNLQVGKRR